jgi:hypothetical protein
MRNMKDARNLGLNEQKALELAKQNADTTLQAICTQPFEESVSKKVPNITVSSK